MKCICGKKACVREDYGKYWVECGKREHMGQCWVGPMRATEGGAKRAWGRVMDLLVEGLR